MYVGELFTGEAPERQVISEAAGVVQQVADGDRCPVVGKLRDVFADVVVQ